MSVTMFANEWLSELRKQYLKNFIQLGGAAVKFIVPQDGLEHHLLSAKLQEAAEDDGYLFVSLDAASTKTNMIDKVFHAVAKQVDWDGLAYNFLRSTLSERYRVPEDCKDFNLEHLASLNGLFPADMNFEINTRLKERLGRDYDMAQEFRIAMSRLCQTQVDAHVLGPGMAAAIKEWLCGELRLVSILKGVGIFQKIGKHNARHMLSSLSHWLHVTGRTGLVVTLDISRYMEVRDRANANESIYYSWPAVMDGYGVLRQFIDDTDDLQHCLIVVIAPPSFLTDERRGVMRYDALRLRIWDEVHDRQRANPLSSLIRLSGE